MYNVHRSVHNIYVQYIYVFYAKSIFHYTFYNTYNTGIKIKQTQAQWNIA